MPERLFTNKLTVTHRLRNGVLSCSTPWLASCQSFYSQPVPTRDAVCLHCFQKICRTGWRETTARTRSAKQGKQRRECALIKVNEKTNQTEHQSARIEARFARRNHSSSSAR